MVVTAQKKRRAKRRAHDSIFTVEVIRGKAGDFDTVAEILDEAAIWVVSRGWRGWKLGSFSRQSLNEQLGTGGDVFGKDWRRDCWQDYSSMERQVVLGRDSTGGGLHPQTSCKTSLRWQRSRTRAASLGRKTALTAGKRYLRLNCLASDRGVCATIMSKLDSTISAMFLNQEDWQGCTKRDCEPLDFQTCHRDSGKQNGGR